ncbi:MAG: sugar phosphate isomerase/epimerase [Acidobacteriia bacterium]|nr:sugar phosphate isomerase/epimerase [Terriglobia bacterium]
MKIETTRRRFLGAAGLAGLAAAATPASARIEAAPWGIKLGIASYSLRKFSRPEAIEMLKTLQTPWLSVKDVHLSLQSTPEQLREARKEFEAAGLKIMSAGNIDMNNADRGADRPEAIRQAFEYARHAGIPMLVCAPTHDNIKTVEGMVKEYDVRIAIHNHGPEDKHFPTPQSVLEVVRPLDPRCGLCLDVGHTARTGAGILKAINDAGSRLFDMHVKDLRDLEKKDSQCDVGDGEIPIPAILKQLKTVEYQGCVNLEYEILENAPLLGMLRSLSYMRGVLAGLAAA